MSEPLIIWLPEDLDEAWAWYRSADLQGWAGDDADRKALSSHSGGNCRVVCPGTWVRTFPHSLPDMKLSERISAAGYAIEEKLAAPLDEQHIVLGTGDDQRVGVIERAKMDLVMARLDELGLRPSQITAEFEAFGGTGDLRRAWNRSIQPGPMGYSMDEMAEGDNPLSLMPEMSFDGALNFASGKFVRRASRMPGAGSFMPLAASLAVAGLAWLVWQGAQARSMNAQTAELKAEAVQLYSDATGKTVDNPAISLTRELRRSGNAPSDFMTLSAGFFEGLKQIDGVYVETMRFNKDRNQLNLKIIYPDFNTATQLEQVFAGNGGQFQTGAVREQNGELIGEGTYTLGGGS